MTKLIFAAHKGRRQPFHPLVAVPTDVSGPRLSCCSPAATSWPPRVSRDGRQLACLVWNHPNLPWDDTELWVGRLGPTHGVLQLLDARREAGVEGESLIEAEWRRHASL